MANFNRIMDLLREGTGEFGESPKLSDDVKKYQDQLTKSYSSESDILPGVSKKKIVEESPELMSSMRKDVLSNVEKHTGARPNMGLESVPESKLKSLKSIKDLSVNSADVDIPESAKRLMEKAGMDMKPAKYPSISDLEYPKTKADLPKTPSFLDDLKKYVTSPKRSIKATLPGLLATGAEMAAGSGAMGDYAKEKTEQILDATPTGKISKVAEKYLEQKRLDELRNKKSRTREEDSELFQALRKRGLAI